MPSGGELSIHTENTIFEEGEIGFEGALPAGSYVCISVSDNGMGMTKAMLEPCLRAVFHHKTARARYRIRSQHDLRIYQAIKWPYHDLQRT